MRNHDCEEFSIISYNVNGLSDEYSYVAERCREISRLVSKESPDVIFFQETTNETCLLYSSFLRPYGYHLISSQQSVQSTIFTVAFSRHIGVCHRAKFDGAATSVMGRDLLKYELLINNRKCLFLSGHLESLAEYSKIRVAQLEEALDVIGKFEGPAILVGDLNIRSKEADGILKRLKKKFKDCAELFRIVDCWEFLGKVDVNKNTWICAEQSLSHIQARYDRMYCNCSFITPVEFRLIGKDIMLSPVLTTPSDHFGIYVKFTVEKEKGDCCNDRGGCAGNITSSISSSNDGTSKIVGSLYSSDHNNSNNKCDSENGEQNFSSVSNEVKSHNFLKKNCPLNISGEKNLLCSIPLSIPIHTSRQISDDKKMSNDMKLSGDDKWILCPDNAMKYSGYKNIDTDKIRRDEGMNKKRKNDDIGEGEVGSRKQLMALAAMKRLLACEEIEQSSKSKKSSCSLLSCNPKLSNYNIPTDKNNDIDTTINDTYTVKSNTSVFNNNNHKNNVNGIDNDMVNYEYRDDIHDISNRKFDEIQNIKNRNADFSPNIIIEITDSPPIICHPNKNSLFKSDSSTYSNSSHEMISLIDD